jgi:hypothetical protein
MGCNCGGNFVDIKKDKSDKKDKKDIKDKKDKKEKKDKKNKSVNNDLFNKLFGIK